MKASCWSEKPRLSPSIANSLKAVTESDSRIQNKIEKQQQTGVLPGGVGTLVECFSDYCFCGFSCLIGLGVHLMQINIPLVP